MYSAISPPSVGTSNRTQKTGVFPGNYVALARGGQRSPQASAAPENGGSRGGKSSAASPRQEGAPPELPPRSASPAVGSSNPISMSWHGQQDSVGAPIGRSSSAIMASQAAKAADKVRCAVPVFRLIAVGFVV